MVHPADVQDRDGAPLVLKAARWLYPWLRHVFADGGYAGEKLASAMLAHGTWTLEIVKRSDAAKGFVLLPRRTLNKVKVLQVRTEHLRGQDQAASGHC